jgi:c-di-GMP-binding flagellar brake protein YcgR
MEQSQTDRRRFRRLPIGAEIEYTVLGKTLTGYVSTASKNICTGGVCIITFDELHVGDTVDLKISLPRFPLFRKIFKSLIGAKGQVIWVNTLRINEQKSKIAYEAGLDFIAIQPADLERIARYVHAKIKK